MKITINSISILNFKGLKSFEAKFNPQVTSIYGDNATGKTSVADAISWCLFGKDSAGRAQFDIKHHDINGNTTPKADVSVSMNISCNGVEHKISRTLKEKWQTKRGETTEEFKGNVTEYKVNGSVYTQADFSKFISSMINESIFKAVSSPTYFTSLPWKEQRTFLSQLAGALTNDEVVSADPTLSSVLPALEMENIENLLKHVKYNISEVTKKIGEIPVRISELNKAMPKSEDWEAIEKDIETKQKELDRLKSEYSQLERGNILTVKITETRRKIEFANKRISEMEKSAYSCQAKLIKESNDYVNDIMAKLNTANASYNTIKKQIDEENAKVNIATSEIEDLKTKNKELQASWGNIQKSKEPSIDEVETCCPTCGQQIPSEKVYETYNIMLADFKKNKKAQLDNINKLHNELKTKKAKADKVILESKERINTLNAELQKMKDELDGLEKALSEKQNEPQLTLEEILNEKFPNYKSVKEELAKLFEELNQDGEADDSELTERKNKLNSEILAIDSDINSLKERYSTKTMADNIQKLIDKANEDNITLAKQLAELQRQEDLYKRFSDTYDSILEERVNKHFSLVKWKMFRTLINGSREPYCECYVDNTAYHDGLNTAMRINAGIDICNTLCRIYKTNSPIVLDNCETSNSILDSDSQQIRFYVSNDKSLTIK